MCKYLVDDKVEACCRRPEGWYAGWVILKVLKAEALIILAESHLYRKVSDALQQKINNIK